MDRRGFLMGLLATAALPHLGRVYSFPTNIVIAKPVRTYVFGRDAIFCTNLNETDAIKYCYLIPFLMLPIVGVDPTERVKFVGNQMNVKSRKGD
jgi:hypothetical protein